MKIIISYLSIICLTLIFFTNSNYTYAGAITNIPYLTVRSVTDPRETGKTFKFKGRVTSVFETKQGIIIIKMYDENQDMHIESPVFPSLGKLKKIPKVGDIIEIIGNLGAYKGRPQIRPLATDYVIVISGPSKDNAIYLSEAIPQIGKNLLIGPVDIINARPFTSKKGKTHLRITVRQNDSISSGIMFDGTWNESDLQALNSGKKILLNAKIDRYKGQPSLVVNRIIVE